MLVGLFAEVVPTVSCNCRSSSVKLDLMLLQAEKLISVSCCRKASVFSLVCKSLGTARLQEPSETGTLKQSQTTLSLLERADPHSIHSLLILDDAVQNTLLCSFIDDVRSPCNKLELDLVTKIKFSRPLRNNATKDKKRPLWTILWEQKHTMDSLP